MHKGGSDSPPAKTQGPFLATFWQNSRLSESDTTSRRRNIHNKYHSCQYDHNYSRPDYWDRIILSYAPSLAKVR